MALISDKGIENFSEFRQSFKILKREKMFARLISNPIVATAIGTVVGSLATEAIKKVFDNEQKEIEPNKEQEIEPNKEQKSQPNKEQESQPTANTNTNVNTNINVNIYNIYLQP